MDRTSSGERSQATACAHLEEEGWAWGVFWEEEREEGRRLEEGEAHGVASGPDELPHDGRVDELHLCTSQLF